jgi:hypothetical protein
MPTAGVAYPILVSSAPPALKVKAPFGVTSVHSIVLKNSGKGAVRISRVAGKHDTMFNVITALPLDIPAGKEAQVQMLLNEIGSRDLILRLETIPEPGRNIAEPKHLTVSATLEAVAQRVRHAQFSNDTASLLLAFHPSGVNARSGMVSSVPCSSVFARSTVQQLGKNPHCSIEQVRGSDVVTGAVNFGVNPKVEAGHLLEFNSRAVTGSVHVKKPISSPKPQAVPRVPKQIGSCGKLVLDGSLSRGFAGRKGQYAWTVVRKGQLHSAEHKSSSAVFEIERKRLLAGSYEATLSVKNFLGEEHEEKAGFSVVDDALPVVSIPGPPKIEMVASEVLSLDAEVSLPSCLNAKAGRLQFNWTVQCESCAKPQTLKFSTRRMMLRRNSLMSSQNYSVQVECSVEGGRTARAHTSVTVTRLPVIALVKGGRSRRVWERRQLVLDGSMSHDPQRGGEMSYEWSCKSGSGTTCPGLGGIALSSPILKIPTASALLPPTATVEDRRLQWTLKVTPKGCAQPCVNSGSAQVDVAVFAAKTLDVMILPFGGKANLDSFDSSQPLRLVASVRGYSDSSRLKFAWSSFGGATLDLNNATRTGVVRPMLALRPNVMEGGLEYHISVKVVDMTKDPAEEGEAEIAIRTVGVPTLGSFDIEPKQGVELDTLFTLSSTGWAVPGYPNAKIYQRFGYKSANGRVTPLSDFSASSSLQVQLPRGEPRLEVVCVVKAVIGDQSTTHTVVDFLEISKQPPLPLEDLQKVVEQDMKSAVSQQDKWQALRLVNSVTRQLENSKASEAASTADSKDGAAIREAMLDVLGSVAKGTPNEIQSPEDIDQMANTLATVTDRPAELSGATVGKTLSLVDGLLQGVESMPVGTEAELLQRVRVPISNSISNAMMSNNRSSTPCKAAWKTCITEATANKKVLDEAEVRQCTEQRRSCIAKQSSSLKQGQAMLKKLIAKEMRNRVPDEGEMKISTPAVEMRVTKVQRSQIAEHAFADSKGARFKLPATLRNRKSCREGDACGMNIVVETWNPAVHGEEVAGPSQDAQTDGGHLASSVTSLTVRDDDENATEIPVSGLEDSEEGAVRISLKYNEPTETVKPGETLQKQCVYYAPELEQFTSDGCTLVKGALEGEVECRCTHLTDFALWVQLVKESALTKERQGCVELNQAKGLSEEEIATICGPPVLSVVDSVVEKYVQLVVAITNFVLAFVVLIKILRFTIPQAYMDGIQIWTINDWQCFLVLLTASVRASVALCKHLEVTNNANLTVSAVLFTVPMLLAFWSASLAIANWARVIHHAIRKGSKSPIAGIEAPYLAFNLVVVLILGICWGMITHADSLDAKEAWAKIGQTSLAVPEIALGLAAIVYGSLLISRIRESIKKFSGRSKDDMQQLQRIAAMQKTGATMVAFAVAFMVQASIEIMAGWYPEIYFRKIFINGQPAYAMSPMNAAYALCSLITCTVIVFVTVKYEELQIAVYDVGATLGAPLVKLSKQFSEMLQTESEKHYKELEAEEKRKSLAISAAF